MTCRWAAMWAVAAAVAGRAAAAEPNESFATRTILGPSVRLVTDDLTPGLLAEAPNTVLGVKDHFGQVYAFDDDASPVGNGDASGLGGVPTNSGSIDFCVSGNPDDFFVGSHGESGEYEVFVQVYDFFDDLIEVFSETRTLAPGEVHDFSFNNFEWIGGSYDAFIDNTVGPLTGGDVDFFTFTGLTPGTMFTAETLDPTASGIDTLLGWFGGDGMLIDFNDDDPDPAGGVLSVIEGVVPAGGAVTLAVTGWEDVDPDTEMPLFMGGHTEDDPYQLRLTVGGGGGGFAADFNNDNMVTGADLALWRSNFGASAVGDADNDNDSDGADFLIWQRELGSAGAAAVAAAVPEPAAGLICVLAAAGVFGVRQRR